MKNRPAHTMIPDRTEIVALAKRDLMDLEIDLDDLYHAAEADGVPVHIGDVEVLEEALRDAEDRYWEAVDLEAEAALAEAERLQEMGLDFS